MGRLGTIMDIPPHHLQTFCQANFSYEPWRTSTCRMKPLPLIHSVSQSLPSSHDSKPPPPRGSVRERSSLPTIDIRSVDSNTGPKLVFADPEEPVIYLADWRRASLPASSARRPWRTRWPRGTGRRCQSPQARSPPPARSTSWSPAGTDCWRSVTQT